MKLINIVKSYGDKKVLDGITLDIEEGKVTARIDTHDLETKMGQIEKFLSKENKVKVTLVLFGRERMHATLGIDTLNEIAEKFAETADVDKKYNEKQKHIILTPKKS